MIRTMMMAAALLLPMGAAAQVADRPEVAAALAAMGTELTREMVGGTNALYAPLLEARPSAGVVHLADQAYGPHERHRLDVWRPESADGTAPVLIFLHGGGFVRGDKGDVANLANWFARHGVVAVAMNYRYAPEATWPAGGEDVAAAMAWVRGSGALHGGDPAKIVVAGNSAGAVHAGTYAFVEEVQAEADGLIGAILISMPSANLTDHPLDPARDALYFGTDPAAYAERSLINALEGRKVPVMLALGGLDMPLAQSQTAQLAAALYARDGVLPVMATAPGHNHISVVGHIGSGDDSLAPAMLAFIRLLAL